MNVTELARKLRVHPKELLRILPAYGFDVGAKAIKVDNKVAQQIMRLWPKMKRDQEKLREKELEEQKKKERELRKESGLSVVLPSIISVKEFADALNLPVTQIIMELMKSGVLANQNQDIDYDTAAILAEDLGFDVEQKDEEVVDIEKEIHVTSAIEDAQKSKHAVKRAPVIVVMGHVDHGKTKLLDTIRKTNIVDKESGGITQHIGAYQTVWRDPKTKSERAITFIDTPGHEAFTVMRSRGAKVADIAILVVAADDGVKPQTEEVIKIMKAVGMPIVVAINKIDKEGADVQKTMTELSQKGLIPEAWGGDIPMVEISAKEELHIDKLLDVLLLVADVHEDAIQADISVPAVGTVIESNVDKSIGPVATILIQGGTLRKGDPIVIGNEEYGKVRAMRDYRGVEMEEAGPSTPAQIIGFKVAPSVGDILNLADAATAEKINVKQKRSEQTGAEKVHIVEIDNNGEDKKKTLNIILKADVLGSMEAIIASLNQVQHEDVGVRIVGKGLGNVTEDDVAKAETTNATIVCFNTKPSPSAETLMREKNMVFEKFEVIYHLLDWVNQKLESLLEFEIIIEEIGKMEVKGIFRTERKWMIVGGLVVEGKIAKGCNIRVKREGEDEGEGVAETVQIGQQLLKQIPGGSEGGIKFVGKPKIEVGDILEAYTIEKRVRKLSDVDKEDMVTEKKHG